jgi:hypothetical protein
LKKRLDPGVAPAPDQDVENDPVLVDRTPEIVLNAVDPDEYLIQMPAIIGLRPALPQPVGKVRANFPHHRRIVSSETITPRLASSSSTSR